MMFAQIRQSRCEFNTSSISNRSQIHNKNAKFERAATASATEHSTVDGIFQCSKFPHHRKSAAAVESGRTKSGLFPDQLCDYQWHSIAVLLVSNRVFINMKLRWF